MDTKLEQLLEQELVDYLDTAYADYGSAGSQLRYFINNVLEILAKEFETYGVIQDMGGRDAAEIVRDIGIRYGK